MMLLCLGPVLVKSADKHSETSSYEIKLLTLNLGPDGQRIQTNWNFQLGDEIRKALKIGIAVKIRLKFEVQKDGWLWNSTLQQKSIYLTLQNNVLSKRYLLIKTNQRTVKSFNEIDDVLIEMSRPMDVEINIPSSILDDDSYRVCAYANIDISALPTPLRHIGNLLSEWQLKGDRVCKELAT